MAFGDLLPNGEIDDKAHSNNGDIIKIFATVIDILHDFTEQNPSYIILFLGSTPLRTLLYKRILKTYYQLFSEKFAVHPAKDTLFPEKLAKAEAILKELKEIKF